MTLMTSSAVTSNVKMRGIRVYTDRSGEIEGFGLKLIVTLRLVCHRKSNFKNESLLVL